MAINSKIIHAAKFFETLDRVLASQQISSKKATEQLEAFTEFKDLYPNQKFNAKDTMFIGAGPLGKLRIWHCHFTQDYSLLYRIKGSNPKKIYLFGFYRHTETGTGTTPSAKIQTNLAKTFKNEFPELAESLFEMTN